MLIVIQNGGTTMSELNPNSGTVNNEHADLPHPDWLGLDGLFTKEQIAQLDADEFPIHPGGSLIMIEIVMQGEVSPEGATFRVLSDCGRFEVTMFDVGVSFDEACVRAAELGGLVLSSTCNCLVHASLGLFPLAVIRAGSEADTLGVARTCGIFEVDNFVEEVSFDEAQDLAEAQAGLLVLSGTTPVAIIRLA